MKCLPVAGLRSVFGEEEGCFAAFNLRPDLE